MSDLASLVRLEDPDFYLDDPFPVYARLRREAPVFWYAPRRTWALSKHDDVRYVATNPNTFSSRFGLFLQDANKGASPAGELFGESGEQIGMTDPPRHTELRRIAAPGFTPRAVAKLTAGVERICDELIGRIEPGKPFDFVEEIAAKLPIQSACEMLGLPHDRTDEIRFWSDELERVGTTELSPEELQEAVANFSGMNDYLLEQFEAKRRNPGDDLISVLLSAELDNDKLSEANVMMFTQTMIAAGNDTTRAMLSGIIATLAEFPDERRKVVADPSIVPGALEEVMRWVTPARGFLRTATQDTELRGQAIKEGEHLYLMYDAANRDEDVFAKPETFDVTRTENHHQVAFGLGTHVCIGAPLVRMETKVFLEKLVGRFSDWEIAGEPRRTQTVLRSGWLELPVVFGS
jgi:cytochrome P450